MERTREIFFTLLRSALINQRVSLETYGSICENEWQSVFDFTTEQDLIGVVLSAIEMLPRNQAPDIDLLMEWVGQNEYITTTNAKYRKNASSFINTVENNGFNVIILKGLACSKYYPVPNRRSLGDLDIFVYPQNLKHSDNLDDQFNDHICAFEKCNDFCEQNGLSVDIHDYKHSHIHFRNLVVENHKYCTEIRGEKVKQQFERHLQELLISGDYSDHTIDGIDSFQSGYFPNPQFNALFLMVHSFTHFLHEELRLRQICDWAMFLKAEQDNVDWSDFYYWMDSLHIRRFADALSAISSDVFGIGISNKAIVNSSIFKDEILNHAMEVRTNLHSQGLWGWRYHVAQTFNIFSKAWKYRDICQQNVALEYIKKIWYYYVQKNPHL